MGFFSFWIAKDRDGYAKDRKGEGAISILRPLRLLCVHCDSSFYIALQKDVDGKIAIGVLMYSVTLN